MIRGGRGRRTGSGGGPTRGHPMRRLWAILPLAALSVLTGEAPGGDGRPRVSFERDIVPILTRAGCNAGACHGKARGQNGFQLSLLGFDPSFDHDAITREARGRRIFPPSPEQSLLLVKATARVPHGGGRRLDPDGPAYRALL